MTQEQTQEAGYWEHRAGQYNNLQWARDKQYLDELVYIGAFSESDRVLDVGCGTGIVANAIAPFVESVVGLDSSSAMLQRADSAENIRYVLGDILDPPMLPGKFDKVVARLVFHHITTDTQRAMDQCYRLLRRGGTMILSEGVPPSDRTKDYYSKIIKLKEHRIVFTETDLYALMRESGFEDVAGKTIWQKGMSVKNWLSGSDLEEKKANVIYDMHRHAPKYFKEDHHTVLTEDDCLIDMKVIIARGEKP